MGDVPASAKTQAALPTSASGGGERVRYKYVTQAMPRSQKPRDPIAVKSEEMLRAQLTGVGSAGWWSDHYEEALSFNGWSYVAITALMRAAASATCSVKQLVPVDEQDGDNLNKGGAFDKKTLRHDHPLCRLLRRPNRRQSLSDLLVRAIMQRRLTGTAMLWVRKNGLGLPAELYILPTALCRPLMLTPEMPEGGWAVSASSLLGYQFLSQIGLSGCTVANLDARDVVRIKYPHPLTEADGQSPQNANAKQIDVSNETEEAIWSVMQQGIMPSILISIDPSLSMGGAAGQSIADGLQADIDSKFAGADKAGKAIIGHGWTAEKLSMSPTDIIPDELRNQNRDNVMATHGVPPIAAGIAGAANYSGLYAARQQMNDGVVQPELDDIASALTIHLCAYYPDGHELEIELLAKPINDQELKIKVAKEKHGTGCYTTDEIRAEFGDGPHPDAEIGSKPSTLAGQPQQPAPGAASGQPAPAAVGGGPEDGTPSEAGDGGLALPGEDGSGYDAGNEPGNATDTGTANPVATSQPIDPMSDLFEKGGGKRAKGFAPLLPRGILHRMRVALPEPSTNGNGKH